MPLKILTAFFLIIFSLPSPAQEKANELQKIKLPNNERVKTFRISPEGKHVVFTSLLDGKARIYSVNEHVMNELPTGTKLNAVVFSKDEYRAFVPFDQGLGIVELPAGETKTLTKESFLSAKRWLWWYRIWNKDKAELLELNWNALAAGTAQLPAVELNDGKIVLTGEDGSKEIDPLDNRYYLSPSLSPDRSMICGVAYGKGTFVCNLDEALLFGPAKLESPIWINNKMIAGAVSGDDGLNIKSSVIKLVDIDSGESQTISTGELKAMYPQFSKANNELFFQTPDGELYTVKLTT
jgi:hypothetical protein